MDFYEICPHFELIVEFYGDLVYRIRKNSGEI